VGSVVGDGDGRGGTAAPGRAENAVGVEGVGVWVVVGVHERIRKSTVRRRKH